MFTMENNNKKLPSVLPDKKVLHTKGFWKFVLTLQTVFVYLVYSYYQVYLYGIQNTV